MIRISYSNGKVGGHGEWFPIAYLGVLADLCGVKNKEYPFLKHEIQFK